MLITEIEGKYHYTHEELNDICDAVLTGKELKYEELNPIRGYIYIFQKYYYGQDVNYLQNLINTLLLYKDKLKDISYAFLIDFLDWSIRFIPSVTPDAVEKLIMLLDPKRKELNHSYLHCMECFIEYLSTNQSKESLIEHDITKYIKTYNEVYHVIASNPIFRDISSDFQYDIVRFGIYIVSYAYYNSMEPKIIIKFMLKFFHNYESIYAKCSVNNMLDRGEINMDYANYIVSDVLSMDNDRKVIL